MRRRPLHNVSLALKFIEVALASNEMLKSTTARNSPLLLRAQLDRILETQIDHNHVMMFNAKLMLTLGKCANKHKHKRNHFKNCLNLKFNDARIMLVSYQRELLRRQRILQNLQFNFNDMLCKNF